MLSIPKTLGYVSLLRQRNVLFFTCFVVLVIIWRPALDISVDVYRGQTGAKTETIIEGTTRHLENIDLSSPHAPFIAWPLRRVCDEAIFVPGLVFLCDNNSGGPGNIRNYILTCVRYAIKAGATTMILPRIRTRSPNDLSSIFRDYRSFAYMFNETHFRASLLAACPQMQVYTKLEDVPGVTKTAERENLPLDKMVELIAPKEYGNRGACDRRHQNLHTDLFGQSFRKWLNESAVVRGFQELSWENPRLIRFKWGVLWDWQTFRDGQEFVASFGGLLRIREDILDIGNHIISSMRSLARNHGQTTNATQSYLGIHLRTEADALQKWPSYDDQVEGYMTEIQRQGFRGGMAYLSSGSETESQKFSDQALSSVQLHVRSKYDILKGSKLEILKSFTWDQHALVDFVVLLGSDYFIGVSPSSFSVNVALKRHLRKDGLYTRPWEIGGQGDGRSWLVGKYEKYWDDWLFMFDGMWP